MGNANRCSPNRPGVSLAENRAPWTLRSSEPSRTGAGRVTAPPRSPSAPRFADVEPRRIHADLGRLRQGRGSRHARGQQRRPQRLHTATGISRCAALQQPELHGPLPRRRPPAHEEHPTVIKSEKRRFCDRPGWAAWRRNICPVRLSDLQLGSLQPRTVALWFMAVDSHCAVEVTT